MFFIATAVVLLLIVLNGLFAMSELAVVSSRKAKLQTRAERGDRGAAAALKLAANPTRFLSAIQIGITSIGILAGAYGQATIARELDASLETIPWLAAYSEPLATAVVVILLTYVSLIVGELVPKRLALLMPETLASLVARPLTIMATVMGPFVTLLTASTAGVLRLLRIKDERGESITQEEVETVLAEGTGAGVIEPEEEQMIHEVMRLGDRPVRGAMTPRPEVYWVSLTDTPAVLADEIRACPYSRFVICEGSEVDRVVGVGHKSLVADLLLAGKDLDLRAVMQEPLFIPETTSMLRAIEVFKASRTHMAFVVDEFGAFEGIVTPADLLEAIAGDFDEAHDQPGGHILQREDGSYLVDGRADVFELSDALEDASLEGSGFQTAAGLILHHLGRFPEEGETLRVGKFTVEVIDMDDRRIDKLIFRPSPPSGRKDHSGD
jgi:putative hemolysin